MNNKIEEVEPIRSEAKIINIPVGNKRIPIADTNIDTSNVVPLAVFQLPGNSFMNKREITEVGNNCYNEGYNDGITDFIKSMKSVGFNNVAKICLEILLRNQPKDNLNDTKV